MIENQTKIARRESKEGLEKELEAFKNANGSTKPLQCRARDALTGYGGF